MRTLFVFLVLSVALLNAAVFQSEVRHGGRVKRPQFLRTHGRWNRATNHRQKRAVGQVPVGDHWADIYLVDVAIGTQAQSFSLSLSTATDSSITWLTDAKCTQFACTGGSPASYKKRQFDTTKSSTYVVVENDPRIDIYSSRGDLGNDTFRMSGLEIKNQPIYVISSFLDEESSVKFFGYVPEDGVLGLGPPDSDEDDPNIVPVLKNLLPQLDQPFFTLWLNSRGHSADQPGGMLTFGGNDLTHCDSNIQWVSSESYVGWTFRLTSASFGGKSLDMDEFTDYGLYGTIDTTLPSLEVYGNFLNIIMDTLGASLDESTYTYIVKCSARSTAPPIVLTANGITLSIPASEYIADENLGNGDCELKLSSNAYNQWFLGAPFLRSLCASFDYREKRVGFSALRP